MAVVCADAGSINPTQSMVSNTNQVGVNFFIILNLVIEWFKN
jgi:hypothetical protein